MENINLKNNQTNCIQEQVQITGTNYIDICNGKITFIPYGSGDWLLFWFAIILVLGAVFCIKKAFK